MSCLFRSTYSKTRSFILPALRQFHHEFTNSEPLKKETKANTALSEKGREAADDQSLGSIGRRYKIFRDEDSTEFFDVVEERDRYQSGYEPESAVVQDDQFVGLNAQRGLQGVFDIEDLVDVLRKETADDIFVCSVPQELKYVDYLVVCSGRSYRHMLAIAEYVRSVYKWKRARSDRMPKIEGEKSREWMAMDLGNIALHIFSPVARETYDLESLWAVGSEYDRESNKPHDPLVELFERHSMLLADVKPPK